MPNFKMNKQSIFEYMLEHIENDNLEKGFTLANWDQELRAKGFVDGATDMVERYDVSLINERNLDGIINEVENAIVLLSNGNFKEADRWFADLGERYRIINISYLIVSYLEESADELYVDNIFEGAMHILMESCHIESVKAALVILSMFEFDYQLKNNVRLFASADEFTYFAVRSMQDWKNGNLEIFEVAKEVEGWGRVYAIEMLEPSNIFIRNWILENGLNINVPRHLIPSDYFELLDKVRNTKLPDEYMYCQVRPYGMDNSYSYIFPGQRIKSGDIVVVPFGYNNELIMGKVVSYKLFSSMNAPYPVERTKSIVRILDNEEIVKEFPNVAEMEGISKENNHDAVDENVDNNQGKKAIVTPINAQNDISDEIDDKSEISKQASCKNREEALVNEATDEIDETDNITDDSSYIQKEINELVQYIKDDDLQSILDWAIYHHDESEDSKIVESVIDAYDYCIENQFKVAVAALNLGSIYYSGVKVKRDYVKAASYYKMAAENGSSQAMCNLGYCYYYGRHEEVSYEKAYKCFDTAGLMGNANGLYKLGDMYLNGYYVKANPKIAFKIYERALDEMEPWNNMAADVNLRLGKCYLRGIGVEQDLDYAMEKLCNAYTGLYARRTTDPFVKGVIKNCRELMTECEKAMDGDFVKVK